MLKTTLAMYGRALKRAGEAFLKSPAALVGLVLAQLTLFAVSVLVGQANLGIIGGFAVGLTAAAAAGSYLFLVEQALGRRKGIGFEVLQESLGKYFLDVINVMFIFFIAQLVLGIMLPQVVLLVAWLVVFVVFNPVPELIYGSQRMGGGLDTLGSSFKWVKRNWPEWFVPQLLLALVVSLTGVSNLLSFLMAFGPRFGFIESLGAVVPLLDLMQGGWQPFIVAQAILVPVATHFTMLFRGALFKELDGGSRRGRAWQARFK